MSSLQRQIRLPAMSRGFHLITSHVEDALPELSGVQVGLLPLFIQHTSASITIHENAGDAIGRSTPKQLVLPPSN